MKNVVFLQRKSWWKDTIYWLLKIFCFELFGDEKYGLSLEPRGWWKRWYLVINENFLFWTFRWWEIRSFFESRSRWKDDIYWLLRSSCFEPFGDGKYNLFFSQKVGGKMIFTWSFWAFHDIRGLGKYGFSCSECMLACNFSFLLFVNILRFYILCVITWAR